MSQTLNASRSVCSQLIDLLERRGDIARVAVLRMLDVRLHNPQAYVTLVGETSSGKSTLVNALLKRQILPVGAQPTTATVTHVVCRHETGEQFFAIYRDATQENIDRSRFDSLSLSPTADLLRLQVRCKPGDANFAGLHVFDTPGYNSILNAHEEVLESFLPESDVVVLVVGYRTGFGQVEQDLFEMVSETACIDQQVPFFLAVNRSPPSAHAEDSRCKEILNKMQDCLGCTPPVVTIHSASTTMDFPPGQESASRIPEASALWERILNEINKPARLKAVEQKLCQLLVNIIYEVDFDLERQELKYEANEKELEEIKEQSQMLKKARDDSLAAVDTMAKRLEDILPRLLKQGIDSLITKSAQEIDATGKWTGAEDCIAWMEGHVLPFGIRELAHAMESFIADELERLDRELNEIANTAVRQMHSRARLKSNAVIAFAGNIARTLGERIGGAFAHNLFRAYGGVGGAAAGAGNLVKMGVARAGRLIGKTFSRQVYNTIGRTFTKKFLKRLGAVVAVVIEGILYVYESKTWQGKLKEKVKEALIEWKSETLTDLKSTQIPAIRKNNEESVRTFYDDLLADEDSGEQCKEDVCLLEETRSLRTDLASLMARLKDAGILLRDNG